MKRNRLAEALLPAYCLFVLALAGCNPPGNGSAVKPVTDTVIISGMNFHPAELWVNKWDTVVWINRDIVSHDVTAFPGKEWTSDTIATGRSWKKEIGQNTDYFCSIHPAMKGKVKVRD